MKAVAGGVLAVAAGLVAGAGAMALVQHGRAGAAGSEVRAYLLDHPEVIPEAMQRLRDRETAGAAAAAGPALTTPVGTAWAGDPKGDVTLVEYYDYNCGYCRASLPTVAALLAADPHLRIVFRELPVIAPSSRPAALASLAAARQGRFTAFHQALFAGGQVSDQTIAAAARTTGVTLPETPAAADRAEIAANIRTAGDLGITGTPSWVVGNRVLIGAQSAEALQAAIKAARGGAS